MNEAFEKITKKIDKEIPIYTGKRNKIGRINDYDRRN